MVLVRGGTRELEFWWCRKHFGIRLMNGSKLILSNSNLGFIFGGKKWRKKLWVSWVNWQCRGVDGIKRLVYRVEICYCYYGESVLARYTHIGEFFWGGILIRSGFLWIYLKKNEKKIKIELQIYNPSAIVLSKKDRISEVKRIWSFLLIETIVRKWLMPFKLIMKAAILSSVFSDFVFIKTPKTKNCPKWFVLSFFMFELIGLSLGRFE